MRKSNSSFAAGHSALSDKSAIEPHCFGDRFHTLSPRACAQSPDLLKKRRKLVFSSQILECQTKSSPTDSKKVSESTLLDSRSISESISSVIASVAKQSIDSEKLESATDSESQKGRGGDSKGVDCHADKSARNDDRLDSKSIDCHDFASAESRNDDKMESCSRISLESQADSEKLECHALPSDKPARNDNKAESRPLQNLKSPADSKKQSQQTPPTRAGFVATLGRPNAGKSSLLNALLGENLALISHKANATRKQLQLIIPYEPLNAQIIFVDTPGIHHQEKLLNQYMLSQALKAMSDCDLALYLAPMTDEVGQYEEFLKLCEGRRHIVLLTKADMCDGDEILSHIARYAPYQSEFLALMPVSVKRGFEREKLLRLIAENLPHSPFYYDSELLSTASTKEIYKELIRESLFENLSDEIPYESDVVIKHFEEKPHLVRIFATIIVEKPSQKAVVIGKGGSGIKRISKHARERLMGLGECAIYLRLDVEVRRGWSKRRESLKKIGYDFAL